MYTMEARNTSVMEPITRFSFSLSFRSPFSSRPKMVASGNAYCVTREGCEWSALRELMVSRCAPLGVLARPLTHPNIPGSVEHSDALRCVP